MFSEHPILSKVYIFWKEIAWGIYLTVEGPSIPVFTQKIRFEV